MVVEGTDAKLLGLCYLLLENVYHLVLATLGRDPEVEHGNGLRKVLHTGFGRDCHRFGLGVRPILELIRSVYSLSLWREADLHVDVVDDPVACRGR